MKSKQILTSPELRGYGLRFYLYFPYYHTYHYQHWFLEFFFAALVVFQLMDIKILIY